MNINPEIALIVSTAAGLIGVVLSLVFTFFPRLNTWFAAQTPDFKRATMSIAGLLVAIIVVLVTNSQAEGETVVESIFQVLLAWMAYVQTNQSTDRILPKPQAVKDAKAG